MPLTGAEHRRKATGCGRGWRAAMLRPRVLEIAALGGVLALAAWLRMGWVGVNSFSFDEARVSLLALEMARRGKMALLGMPSSTGLPNFPANVWAFVLPYGLSPDPLVATLFVGLLGTCAVAGAWWLARRAWGPWAGLTTGLLFATSPYGVLYARNIWGQNLLPPLAVLWALAGVVGIGHGKPWLLALHAFLAGFAFQVHYAGLALIPATAWVILRYRLWARWRELGAGGILAALCTLPFAYGIWCCARSVRAALSRLLSQPAQLDTTAWRQWAELGAGANWEWLLLGNGWAWPRPIAESQRIANLLAAALIAMGAGVMLWRAWWRRGRARPAWEAVLAALLPAWALAAPLAFMRHTTPAYHQYQLTALPALLVIAGAAAGARPGRGWGLTITALAFCVAVLRALPMAQGLGIVAQRLTPGGIGTPLMFPREAARALKDGRPIIVHAHGDAPEFLGDVAGFEVLLWDYPHRIVDGRSVALIPELDARGAHLMVTFGDLPAWDEMRAVGLEGTERALPRRQGEPPYLALTIRDVSLEGLRPVEPLSLANGAQLQAWNARRANGQLRITTCWKLAEPPPPGRYHQFNHLRTAASSNPLSIHDVPLSSQAWQVGDTLISWADFDMPTQPGPYYLDVGMYTWPDVRRVAVVGRAGDPLAPIRLGPFEP